MSPDPADRDSDAQRRLAAYIRDPEHAPAPRGIQARRLKVYRELFFNNIASQLAGNFPVIKRILGDRAGGDRWTPLVRDFYRGYPSRTPLFTELPREFVRYLESRAAAGSRDDPPWLPELAHYEWIELALQISPARLDDVAHDPGGDLLAGCPLLSPLAWPLAYAWPVHRIAPDFQPDAPPAEPTCLLLQRDTLGKVHFQQLSALTYRLLQRLQHDPECSGRGHLLALAAEAATDADDAFIEQGRKMLTQLRASAVILGTRRDQPTL